MTSQILTEEELKEREQSFNQLYNYGSMSGATRDKVIEVIESHISSNKRNRLLVQENDGFLAEITKYKTALYEITQVCTDYFEDDAKLMTKFAEDALEELK